MNLLLKFAIGAVLIFAVFILGIVGAIYIETYFRPSQVFLVHLAISAISFLLIAGLTVWRVLTMPRLATITLIASVPIMTTVMGSLVYYWDTVSAVLFKVFPWLEWWLWWVGDIIHYFERVIHG